MSVPNRRRRDGLGNRVVLRAVALRAAYEAHKADTHSGRNGLRCHTCSRYAVALVLARRTENEGLS